MEGRKREKFHASRIGDVEVVTERGVEFRRGFAVIVDAFAHDPFQQLPVLMVFKRGEGGRDEKRKSSITIRGDRAYYPAGIPGSCLRATFAASHVSSTQQLLLEEFSMDTTLFQRFPLFSLTVCQKWGGELSTPGV